MRPIKEQLTAEDLKTVEDMNGDFVDELSEPLSRILARNRFNESYGRPVVDSYDWLGVMIAFWGYRRDLTDLRDRRKVAIQMRKMGVVTAGAPTPEQPVTPPRPAPIQFGDNDNVTLDPEAQIETLGPVGIAVPPGAGNF